MYAAAAAPPIESMGKCCSGRTFNGRSSSRSGQGYYLVGYVVARSELTIRGHLDSLRQAYFHDRPNILSVHIDVKILSQEYNIQVSKDN